MDSENFKFFILVKKYEIFMLPFFLFLIKMDKMSVDTFFNCKL